MFICESVERTSNKSFKTYYIKCIDKKKSNNNYNCMFNISNKYLNLYLNTFKRNYFNTNNIRIVNMYMKNILTRLLKSPLLR